MIIKAVKAKCFPRLIVFDLDHTLWPFGVDQFIFKPPYRRVESKILDSLDQQMKCFDEVPHILKTLSSQTWHSWQTHSNGNAVELAVASRTEYPIGALSLIQLFGWNSYFKYKEIYAGPKTEHFQQFTNKSLINYKDMLFLDDEERNINDIQALGVTCILVDGSTGVTTHLINEGIERFNELRSIYMK